MGYGITVLDENGNKVRKQVSESISPDKQVAEEFAAKKTLSEYTDKKKLLKRDISIQQFYEEYKKNYSTKKKRPNTLCRDTEIFCIRCGNMVKANQISFYLLN
ncbi:MAG: hypothetical protein LE178_05140 [Endomicrobium sp.]|nr:hypothetical protein [Endomicrobium sp.]